MKKFCITALTFGLILCAAGFTIVGIFKREGYNIEDAFDDGHHSHAFESTETTQVLTQYADDEKTVIGEVTYEHAEHFNKDEDSYSHYYSSCDIKGIEIESAAADVYISCGDQLSVSAYGINTKKFSEIIDEDGILKIDYNTDGANLVDLLDQKSVSIDITVPFDFVLPELDVDIDAGAASISSIGMDVLKLDLSAGNISISQAIVSISSEIDITAGDIYVYDSRLNDTIVEMTAGNIYTSDNTYMTGITEIDMAAGNVDLWLTGYVSDYTYEISKTAGTLSINGSEKIPDTHGSNIMRITMTAGDCGIYFEEQ